MQVKNQLEIQQDIIEKKLFVDCMQYEGWAHTIDWNCIIMYKASLIIIDKLFWRQYIYFHYTDKK